MPSPVDQLPQDVVAQVRSRLLAVAADNSVEVLHAIESGSRAWGFASPDSDYDVRFIYSHPRNWYLSVHERRDVIETPIEEVDGTTFDVNGWDLRKALRLLAKSNPVLIEWLQSPIVYSATPRGGFADEMLDLAHRVHSARAAHYHYFHMARKNFREHLLDETIKLKKYFYVLRPILACLWLERGFGIPPMELLPLLNEILPSGALRDDILELRERKMRTPEFGSGPPIASLQAFLAAELERLGATTQPDPPRVDDGELDAFLRRWIRAERVVPGGN